MDYKGEQRADTLTKREIGNGNLELQKSLSELRKTVRIYVEMQRLWKDGLSRRNL